MHRKRRTKKTQKVLVKHAGLRAAQRYGVCFGEAENQNAVRQIQQGKAVLIERQSLRVSVWKVTIEGVEIPVCYDNRRKSIITCLPPECLNWENQNAA